MKCPFELSGKSACKEKRQVWKVVLFLRLPRGCYESHFTCDIQCTTKIDSLQRRWKDKASLRYQKLKVHCFTKQQLKRSGLFYAKSGLFLFSACRARAESAIDLRGTRDWSSARRSDGVGRFIPCKQDQRPQPGLAQCSCDCVRSALSC